MKNFIQKTLEWKTWACLMFTGSMVVYMAISWFFGSTEIPLLTVLSILITSAAGTFCQFLFFTNNIIKKMRYSARTALFAISFFAVLAAAAYFFNWFPRDGIGSWIIFGLIFVGILIIFTIFFEIIFKITGKKYDGFLGQYKKSKEENLSDK